MFTPTFSNTNCIIHNASNHVNIDPTRIILLIPHVSSLVSSAKPSSSPGIVGFYCLIPDFNTVSSADAISTTTKVILSFNTLSSAVSLIIDLQMLNVSNLIHSFNSFAEFIFMHIIFVSHWLPFLCGKWIVILSFVINITATTSCVLCSSQERFTLAQFSLGYWTAGHRSGLMPD